MYQRTTRQGQGSLGGAGLGAESAGSYLKMCHLILLSCTLRALWAPQHPSACRVLEEQGEGPQERHHVCLSNPITFFDKKTGFMAEGRVVEIIYFQFSQAFNAVSQCSDIQGKVVLSR